MRQQPAAGGDVQIGIGIVEQAARRRQRARESGESGEQRQGRGEPREPAAKTGFCDREPARQGYGRPDGSGEQGGMPPAAAGLSGRIL